LNLKVDDWTSQTSCAPNYTRENKYSVFICWYVYPFFFLPLIMHFNTSKQARCSKTNSYRWRKRKLRYNLCIIYIWKQNLFLYMKSTCGQLFLNWYRVKMVVSCSILLCYEYIDSNHRKLAPLAFNTIFALITTLNQIDLAHIYK